MVNTRILEQRLGWRRAGPGEEPAPPSQPMRHVALLQGRVNHGQRPQNNVNPPERRADPRPEPHAEQRFEPRREPTPPPRGARGWDAIPMLAPDIRDLDALDPRVPEYGRDTVVGRAMDEVRAQLLRVSQAEGWRRIGITSAGRRCGRSLITAALATSLARLDTVRVLAVDADLERPGLHAMMGLPVEARMHDLVSDPNPATAHHVLRRVGQSLAVALSDRVLPGAADRLLSPRTIQALDAMVAAASPDLALFDLPPLMSQPVTAALLPHLDAVILLADGLRDTATDILECERVLEGQAPILGVVLNRSEDTAAPRRSRRR